MSHVDPDPHDSHKDSSILYTSLQVTTYVHGIISENKRESDRFLRQQKLKLCFFVRLKTTESSLIVSVAGSMMSGVMAKPGVVVSEV